MSKILPLNLCNAETAALKAVPRFTMDDFRQFVIEEIHDGARLVSLFAWPGDADQLRLIAVLADEKKGNLALLQTDIGNAYPALTPQALQAHYFEREIAEQWSINPVGHPWLKPVRFLPSRVADKAGIPIGITDYFEVQGAEIHEVAVGPVHAGIIEPGHFRFQCHGENVLHLEISLGYQHRGVERAMTGGPSKRSIHYMETLAGDTTIGHAFAYCQLREAFFRGAVPPRAHALRGVALELERMANHIGDLGALAGDVGFLPTASYCGRIRGDVLNLTALMCGNRFGRNLIRPGGVAFDLNQDLVGQLLERLQAVERDTAVAVNLLWDNPSVMARFEETGIILPATAQQIGLVGPAARACGLERDVRKDMPSGIFSFAQIHVSTWNSGDVFARAYVRWLEIQRSLTFVRDQLANLPPGPIEAAIKTPAPDHIVVSLVEGWRGEICHVALTDSRGLFSCYKIVDPSFHNWFGLAYALRNQQISDFPLCNKSFNLSYCGHDL
jgi:Ni,Fe-hydrogenase III large subunit